MICQMGWLSADRNRLDLFRQGDRTTLAETYRQYVNLVANVLSQGFSFASGEKSCRFGGCTTPFELDDLLQDVFLRAFSERARQAYDGVRPYRAYLLAIARNTAIDRFRRAGRQPNIDPRQTTDASLDTPASEVITPEQQAIQNQLRRLLATFKKKLPTVERELFERRFEQHQTRAQITEALGLSPMQVRTREKQLKQQLLDHLDRAGGSPWGLWLLLAMGAGRGLQ